MNYEKGGILVVLILWNLLNLLFLILITTVQTSFSLAIYRRKIH